MKIVVDIIPHSDQRYETCGDWYYDDDGTLQIRVSECGNYVSETAVAVHEIVEAMLCKVDGVPLRVVDEWDMAYLGNEPGDDPGAPYHRQHVLAEIVERIMLLHAREDWWSHSARIDALFGEKS